MDSPDKIKTKYKIYMLLDRMASPDKMDSLGRMDRLDKLNVRSLASARTPLQPDTETCNVQSFHRSSD